MEAENLSAISISKPIHSSPAYLPRLEVTTESSFHLIELLSCPPQATARAGKKTDSLCFTKAKDATGLLAPASMARGSLTFTFLQSGKLGGAILFSFHSWAPC